MSPVGSKVAGAQEGVLGDPHVGARTALECLHRFEDARVQRVARGALVEDLRGQLPQPAEHVVGERPQLYAVVAHQGLERLAVARGELGEDPVVDGLAAGEHDLLQVLRQPFEGLAVDDRLERGTGLVPAGVIVVPGRLVQAEGEVVVGADPLGRVDRAGLERSEDLAEGKAEKRLRGLSFSLSFIQM